LREFIVKGFTLDDERLKQAGGRVRVRKTVCRHARPHPSPLPQERENRPLASSHTCVWIGRTHSRENKNGQRLFPLLGGEGRGEGER
jgi:hypothetical protein